MAEIITGSSSTSNIGDARRKVDLGHRRVKMAKKTKKVEEKTEKKLPPWLKGKKGKKGKKSDTTAALIGSLMV